jgi:hypothetical protein
MYNREMKGTKWLCLQDNYSIYNSNSKLSIKRKSRISSVSTTVQTSYFLGIAVLSSHCYNTTPLLWLVYISRSWINANSVFVLPKNKLNVGVDLLLSIFAKSMGLTVTTHMTYIKAVEIKIKRTLKIIY